MQRWRALAVVTAMVGAAAAWAPARAQLAPSSNGPIDITADEAEVQSAKCLSTWRGAAEALQGQTRLRADMIRASAKPKGVDSNGQANCGPTDKIEADGDVYYVTPTQIAHGRHAVYTADSDEIVFTGDVIVVQGKDVARGDRLVIHVSTRDAQMESAVKGRGKPGRVRGVFYPGQPGTPGQSGAPTILPGPPAEAH
jgi:lipopolysaccharide export system protein LptA